MDIQIVSERYSLHKIEKVFVLSVNGIQLTISKWSYYKEEGNEYEEGWNFIGSAEAYGELTDEEQDAVNEFIDKINLN